MAQREQPRILQRLEARREAYKDKGVVYRTAWVVAGVIVVLAGIAMVVFPGPAIVVIPLGLAMLSFEFAWAQRLLDRGVDGGLEVKDRIVHADTRSKVLGGIALAAALATVIAIAVAVLT